MTKIPFSLYPHQEKALKRIKNGSILWGGVGSGKSITALAYYHTVIGGGSLTPFRSIQNKKDIYIITTARKRDTLEWDKEAIRFLITSHTDDNPLGIKYTVDSWNNIKKYTHVKDAFFIFDEQRVVGYGAWTKSFLQITKKNKWILLSATPGDTWSDYMPVFIAKGYYKHKTDFTRQHVIYNSFVNFPLIDRYVNTDLLEKRRREVLVHMPYRKHTTPRHKRIFTEYDKEQHDIVLKDRWNIYTDEPIQNVSELGYTVRKVVNSDPSRIEAVKNLMKHHDRIIIFYNFDYELGILRTLKENTTVAEWNGHKHEPIPNTDSWIYLVQYTAGSEGWNCVETDTMIFYSQNYSYRIMHQASGRIDRLNTPYKILNYYHILSKAPIDGAILGTLGKKKTFNEKKYFENTPSQKKQRL